VLHKSLVWHHQWALALETLVKVVMHAELVILTGILQWLLLLGPRGTVGINNYYLVHLALHVGLVHQLAHLLMLQIIRDAHLLYLLKRGTLR